ncbi:MAG: hypothetical protein KAI53_05090 [Candidatus Aenigmarchaeota archaeon]|nr:hypothetical protein [Candidatus Aenigmarchaeota archaeon]
MPTIGYSMSEINSWNETKYLKELIDFYSKHLQPGISNTLESIFFGGREEEMKQLELEKNQWFFDKLNTRIFFNYKPYDEFWKMPEKETEEILKKLGYDLRTIKRRYLSDSDGNLSVDSRAQVVGNMQGLGETGIGYASEILIAGSTNINNRAYMACATVLNNILKSKPKKISS